MLCSRRPWLLAVPLALGSGPGAGAADWVYEPQRGAIAVRTAENTVSLRCESGGVGLAFGGGGVEERRTEDIGLSLDDQGPFLFPAPRRGDTLVVSALPAHVVEKLGSGATLRLHLVLPDPRRSGRAVLTAVSQVPAGAGQETLQNFLARCGDRMRLAGDLGAPAETPPLVIVPSAPPPSPLPVARAAPPTALPVPASGRGGPPSVPGTLPSGSPLSASPPSASPASGAIPGHAPNSAMARSPGPARSGAAGTMQVVPPGVPAPAAGTVPASAPAPSAGVLSAMPRRKPPGAGTPAAEAAPPAAAGPATPPPAPASGPSIPSGPKGPVPPMVVAPDSYRWQVAGRTAGLLFAGEYKLSGILLVCDGKDMLTVVVDMPRLAAGGPLERPLEVVIDDQRTKAVARVIPQVMESSRDLVFAIPGRGVFLDRLARGRTLALTAGQDTVRYSLKGSGEPLKALKAACGP